MTCDASLGGKHHAVENKTGACHTRRISERRPIEISDPDADCHLACVADGPVVPVSLGGAGLDRGGKWKIEASTATENEFARVWIGKDVGNPEGGSFGHHAV